MPLFNPSKLDRTTEMSVPQCTQRVVTICICLSLILQHSCHSEITGLAEAQQFAALVLVDIKQSVIVVQS